MTPRPLPVAETLAALALLLQVLRSTKLGGFPVDDRLSRGEVWTLWLVAIGLRLVGDALGGSGPLAALAVALLALVAVGLWLDAVLFRVFTIELGPGGVKDVVASVLYRELSELESARRFFAAHATVLVVPVAALATVGAAVIPLGSLGRTLAAIVLAPLLAASALAVRDEQRGRTLGPFALWLLAVLVERALARPWGPWWLALPVAGGLLALARRRDARRPLDGPAGLAHFFRARRLVDAAAFSPRAEHAALAGDEPRLPSPSDRHGLLAGCDVLLFTFESVARDHLAAHRDGGARTPFFDDVARRGLSSRRHVSPCPTTNDAHRALYAGLHDESAAGGLPRALARAGYQTVYLTAARTGDYGLRGLLERAGFEHILDGATLSDPAASEGREATDARLLDRGLDALTRLRGPASVEGAAAAGPSARPPLFLHVHATATHLPYRVLDPAAHHRFGDSDEGRLKDGIEESDAILGALHRRLVERGLVDGQRGPLVVVTSDHGQAFGALGYQSHGSAVVADEVGVPFALAHDRLERATVAASTHFDVGATVCDLLGVVPDGASLGRSLFGPAPSPFRVLLRAGHPSRTTSSHFGAIVAGEKLMLDLVLDRCHRMDPDDRAPALLGGAEKDYVRALLARAAARQRAR